ncbi:MAG: GlcNAc-transferase family protein [Thiomicrospira sp.]
MSASIFISVASFCDPHLLFTIQSALTKASQPKRLVFGVVDQHPENRREQLKSIINNAKLRYVHIHPVDSRGVCWARALCGSLYQQEHYYLQIDSHTLFEQDWDTRLIADLEFLQANRSTWPIISTYPYGFEFENDRAVVKINVSTQTVLALKPKQDQQLTPESAVLRFEAKHIYSQDFIAGCHLAGGFIFTLGSFIDHIPYDPHLYFHGEEQNLTIRAYTRGWDIFHPPSIPLYHLYKRADNEYLSHHWHSEWEKQRDFKWHEVKQHAEQRLKALLYDNADLGVYGLGQVRTLNDFAQFCGIDYEKREIHRHVFLPDAV